MSDIQLTPFLELSEEKCRTFYEMRYSDYVHGNFGGKKPTLDSHLNWMKSSENSDSYNGFAITLNDLVIGGCSLKNISQINSNAEFDIFLSEDSSGKGYGKIALKQLLTFGFAELGLHRIYAFLIESNQNAFKMYQGLGFKKEGVIRENVRKNNEYLNSIIIGLLKKEYEYHY